jgi:hypothetical protein
MADIVKTAGYLWLRNATISDNRQCGSDMQPEGILEMSLDNQELRAIRHHPGLKRSKAVTRGEFTQLGRLKAVTLLLTGLLIMAVSSGGAGNSALVAKVNRAYGTSFAVSS